MDSQSRKQKIAAALSQIGAVLLAIVWCWFCGLMAWGYGDYPAFDWLFEWAVR